MSEMKRLDEALGQWTDYRVKRDLVPILDPVETEALLTAFTAARTYRDLLANGQRVEPDYEAARQELIRQLLPGLWPTIASRAIVDAAIGDKLLIDPTTAAYKPVNAKGKRHHIDCLNDEPGVTLCICDPITQEVTGMSHRGGVR